MEKCPEKDQATHICFNCGSERHALRDCPQPSAGGETDTPFPMLYTNPSRPASADLLLL